MKASELRIGNYVQAKSLEKYIYESPVLINEGYFEMILNNLIDIKPIPLTEDWIVRFGFKKNKYGYYVNNTIHFLIGETDETLGKIILAVNLDKTVIVEHVHQLQNLYFALTGQELICQ